MPPIRSGPIPIRGEYRLAPGNQEPPGYVIPLDRGLGLSNPKPGEYRLGSGNQEPLGVVVPLYSSGPSSGESPVSSVVRAGRRSPPRRARC